MVRGCKRISYKGIREKIGLNKTNEKILRYKLEAYQKNFLEFIYGNPTSTEVSGQYEKIEARFDGTTHEEEMQIEEPQDLRSGTTQEEEVQLEKPQDLKEKKPLIIQEQEKGGGYFNNKSSGNIFINQISGGGY